MGELLRIWPMVFSFCVILARTGGGSPEVNLREILCPPLPGPSGDGDGLPFTVPIYGTHCQRTSNLLKLWIRSSHQSGGCMRMATGSTPSKLVLGLWSLWLEYYCIISSFIFFLSRSCIFMYYMLAFLQIYIYTVVCECDVRCRVPRENTKFLFWWWGPWIWIMNE